MEMPVETVDHVRKAHRAVMGSGPKVTFVAKAANAPKRVRAATISVAKETSDETTVRVRKDRRVVTRHAAKGNRDRNRNTSTTWISQEK
jgi:hypothetical protein